MIDLRSDTVTRPTSAMLDAMMKAPVGDDVFSEDPSVNKLEELSASIFGMEAALYCPTGTMSNQVAIKAHTQPGDEVICDKTSHVYQYEGGGIARNSGAQVKLIDGNLGRITAEQVAASINPDDVHKANTSLVSLENTANRGGGSCYELEEIKNIRSVCDKHDLKLHLDGARLFNALVAKRQSALEFGRVFHSISVCLNKGLGCPIGSMLMGKSSFIKKARRIRKVFGGGMRQAGYMAAAGIYALQNHIDRLQQDHDHAKIVADAILQKEFCGDILPVETNILIFSVRPPCTADGIVKKLRESEILALPISPTQIRMVFHLDIQPVMVEKMVSAIKSI